MARINKATDILNRNIFLLFCTAFIELTLIYIATKKPTLPGRFHYWLHISPSDQSTTDASLPPALTYTYKVLLYALYNINILLAIVAVNCLNLSFPYNP